MHALGLLLCLFSAGCHEPVGIELTYAVNRAEASTKKIDMHKALKAVQQRLRLLGTAELVGDRIKVGVYGAEQKNVERVKKLIAQAGVLEFRILADRRVHRKVIELATSDEFAEKSDVRKKPDDEFPVAQWCSVEQTEGRRLTMHEELVTRSKDERIEALVVIDSYHVTGADFSKAYKETDQYGQPCVFFQLSADGAKRMRRLTSENLPADVDVTNERLLGIILDGQLQSAPGIRSVIEERGQITGRFTEQEADQLCLILSAGSLPVHLELVEQSAVEAR